MIVSEKGDEPIAWWNNAIPRGTSGWTLILGYYRDFLNISLYDFSVVDSFMAKKNTGHVLRMSGNFRCVTAIEASTCFEFV